MRASDADRDRIAAVLRDAHAEGRLTQEELLERLESVYTSRTYQDLDQLVVDLPMPRSPGTIARVSPRPVSAPRPAVSPVRRTVRRAARVSLNVGWWMWGTAVAINLVIWFIIAVAQGQDPVFWPAFVAGPWGVLLAAFEIAYRRGGKD